MNWPPRVGVLATLGLMFCPVAASEHPASGREAKEMGTAASDADPHSAGLTGGRRTGKFLQVVPKTSPAQPEALGCV